MQKKEYVRPGTSYDDDIERVAAHFRSKIRMEKQKLEEDNGVINYMDLVRDAPDEAFAGVDDKNISSMFELVQKLDFDYIMNSQALWGCFKTVKRLRIEELLRPQNSKTVSVIRYTWNGRERVLDEQ